MNLLTLRYFDLIDSDLKSLIKKIEKESGDSDILRVKIIEDMRSVLKEFKGTTERFSKLYASSSPTQQKGM